MKSILFIIVALFSLGCSGEKCVDPVVDFDDQIRSVLSENLLTRSMILPAIPKVATDPVVNINCIETYTFTVQDSLGPMWDGTFSAHTDAVDLKSVIARSVVPDTTIVLEATKGVWRVVDGRLDLEHRGLFYINRATGDRVDVPLYMTTYGLRLYSEQVVFVDPSGRPVFYNLSDR